MCNQNCAFILKNTNSTPSDVVKRQYNWPLVLPQAVCAIFEKSVKTLTHDFAPMVSQLSEMLGQMYSTIPQVSALDLTRQVGTEKKAQRAKNCL